MAATGEHLCPSVPFFFIYVTLEGNETSCLCALQPHVDRRPPAPADDHCSKWSGCGLVRQGVQDPFCCFVSRPGDMEDCWVSRRGDSSAEGLLKPQISKASPLGHRHYQPSIATCWLPPGLGSHGGRPKGSGPPWQSSWPARGDSTQGHATTQQYNVWEKHACCWRFCF